MGVDAVSNAQDQLPMETAIPRDNRYGRTVFWGGRFARLRPGCAVYTDRWGCATLTTGQSRLARKTGENSLAVKPFQEAEN